MIPLLKPGAIAITDNDKGGIGKSFFALVCAHCLISADLPWIGIDGDRRNAHLFRFHGPAQQVRRMPLQTEEQWDKMIDTIERDVPLDATVLIDCPAGAGHMMEACGPKLKAFAAHQGRPFLRLCALDNEDDVLLALDRTRHLGFDTVVAGLGGLFAPSAEAFDLWNKPMRRGQSMRDEVLTAAGLEIYIPRLRASVHSQLWRANLPFHRAGELVLSWTETNSLSEWIDDIEIAFAPVLARITGDVR